jgi:hypothetical protein
LLILILGEKRALKLLKRLRDKGELKEYAAEFIALCIARKWKEKKFIR